MQKNSTKERLEDNPSKGLKNILNKFRMSKRVCVFVCLIMFKYTPGDSARTPVPSKNTVAMMTNAFRKPEITTKLGCMFEDPMLQDDLNGELLHTARHVD